MKIKQYTTENGELALCSNFQGFIIPPFAISIPLHLLIHPPFCPHLACNFCSYMIKVLGRQGSNWLGSKYWQLLQTVPCSAT